MGWNARNARAVDESEVLMAIQSSERPIVRLDWEERQKLSFQKQAINFSKLVAIGSVQDFTVTKNRAVPDLKSWLDTQQDFALGYFSYDLKNELESLVSKNLDLIGFATAHFFVPRKLYLSTDEGWVCFGYEDSQVVQTLSYSRELGEKLKVPTYERYTHQVENLKQHIQFGDVYEVNYCVQHGYSRTSIDPFGLYCELQQTSPAPFSCFIANEGKYLMSSSPERFMKKEGVRVVSQPMKGTNRRSTQNDLQKAALRNNGKEVAENVMITDLVRNDLSRSAKKGTVKVDELCGVYEFEHVNQMVSTVSAELRDDVHPLDVLLNAFPMGSMTGAPKIRAMELIDQFEDFSRGLYSGSVGYFTPDLDFDFNVVIRSILYNEEKQVVTFPTGGAITINSDPEKEYEECVLKAEAMRNVLLNHAK